jgi:putative RecB family exonuclease
MITEHLSYTQISTYMTCPLRYRLQYVDKIPPAFKSAALAFGSAIHEAIGAFYHQHLLGDSLRPDQMTDVYREAWRNGDQTEIRFFNGDSEDSLLEKAKRMLQVFHDNFDPTVAILGVEEFFELPVDGIPPLCGYIDLIEQNSEGSVTLADLKTAARKPVNGAVHQNLQLTAYSVGVEALGFSPDTVNLRLDVLTKTKEPQMVRLETIRTNEDRERFIRLIKQVWNAIEQEVFFPRHDWHCGQCAWADTCAKW